MGFWIKKYFKDNWGSFLFDFLFVSVFGYFALGKAMDIAQPKVMLIYIIVGVIFILVAILRGIFTLKNKDDMPFSVFGLRKEKYQVINNEKFNSIMLIQSIVLFIWLY